MFSSVLLLSSLELALELAVAAGATLERNWKFTHHQVNIQAVGREPSSGKIYAEFEDVKNYHFFLPQLPKSLMPTKYRFCKPSMWHSSLGRIQAQVF